MSFGTVEAFITNRSVQDNGQLVNKKRAFANIAASQTDAAVVAAVSGYKIRVLAYTLMAGGTATNVTFNSKPGGAGTAISCLHACNANGGITTHEAGGGWFETIASEGLSVTTGAGSTTGIQVIYVEVKV